MTMLITFFDGECMELEAPRHRQRFIDEIRSINPQVKYFTYLKNQEEVDIQTDSDYQEALIYHKYSKEPVLTVFARIYPDDDKRFKRSKSIYNEESLLAYVFYNNTDKIDCYCQQGCMDCGNTKRIEVASIASEINTAVKRFLDKNFETLKRYIKNHYDVEIQSIQDWTQFHQDLTIHDSRDDYFIFKCNICKRYYKKSDCQTEIYKRGQDVVCVECYKQNPQSDYQRKWTKKLKEQEKEQSQDFQFGLPRPYMIK